MDDIQFGTDGWRSVMADGFTFRNVKRVAQAACDVARKTSKSRLILIGYDRRFYSDQFAQTAARVASGNGFRVEMTKSPISSPCLSFHVKNRKAAMGFMITASHNPYYFNGFKLKGPHGGSVNGDITKSVEDRLDTGEIQEDEDTGKNVELENAYLAFLKKLVKTPRISSLKGPVIFDGMHGPGGPLFERLFSGSKDLKVLHVDKDPLFGGINPEPIETNLAELKDTVLKQKASIGIAVDGDADRIGVIDDTGRYLPPQTVMPLLLLHLIEDRKLKGSVIQTVSMGYLPSRIAQQFKLPFEEVSVGFKHIALKMGEQKVLLGGEESGGYGVGLWSPERDGLLCALLLLEYMIAKKKPLSVLVDELYTRFGTSHFKRVDFDVPSDFERGPWLEYVKTLLAGEIAGVPIKTVVAIDGLKVVTKDDSWFLMRPSGTEPLLRTYAEASSPELLDKLISEAGRLVRLSPPNPKKAAEEAKRLKKRKLALAAAKKK